MNQHLNAVLRIDTYRKAFLPTNPGRVIGINCAVTRVNDNVLGSR